jgi:hypothetical protein
MSYDKIKSRSQTGNLTFDHKLLESKGQMNFDWGVLYTIGNISFEGYKILPSNFQNKLDLRKI